MTLNKIKKQLSLIVLNMEQLVGPGLTGEFNFNEEGGTLGSSDQDDWQLLDRLGAITASHARIEFHDDQFCLCDLSGQSYINGMSSPIGRSRRVCLQQGDELGIGTLKLRVFRDASIALPEPLFDATEEQQLDTWLASEQCIDDVDSAMSLLSDPLIALQGDSPDLTSLLPESPIHVAKHLVTPSAITFTAKRADQGIMNMQNTIEPQGALVNQQKETSPSVAPILRGLGLLQLAQDPPQSYVMLEEMGQTLRAVVEGLLALQTEHAALADKRLRPIEDNPLRMGLDYDSTVTILFAEPQNPVHLTAPEAVAESLNNVRIHHLANQQAIAAALASTIKAFSPEALLSRFTRYRRSESEQGNDNAWAWGMYQHFYGELTSVRQQGFEKLFYQVYAQAYDQALRQQPGVV